MMVLEMADNKKAYFEGKTFSYKDMIKVIPGSSWNKVDRRWEIPLESVEDARRILPSLQISEALMTAYSLIKGRNAKALELKIVDESSISCEVKGLKGKLYPYQAVGKAFLDNLQTGEGAILAFDMGLGKSISSLATFLDWKQRGIVDYCLVVCPSPLKYSTWEKEITKWTDLEYCIIDGDKTEVVEWEDGKKEKMKGQKLRQVQYAQWQFGANIIVMNYELFLRDAGRGKPGKDDYEPCILPPINERWCVILDECQRVKNPKAQTTKSLLKIARPAGRKIPMSGTPLENNIQELWSIVDLCRPGLLGNNFKFIERYCEKDYWGTIVGPKTQLMPELKAKIAPLMLRKTKEEALPDLPELTVQEYWVNMTPEQTKLYKLVKEGILENLKTGEFSYLEALAQITRIQQLVDSPALLKEVLGNDQLPIESGKLNELKHIIEDLDPSKNKFVLFSQYREMTKILYQWLIDEKILLKEEIGYIHGGMKSSETASIQDGFQNGSLKCVLMTTAGNYGIELSRGSYIICYDQLFNPQKMNQIYSRVHRNGVKQAVIAINLVTRGTYEERKMEILLGKKEIFKAMIDAPDEDFVKKFTKDELLKMI